MRSAATPCRPPPSPADLFAMPVSGHRQLREAPEHGLQVAAWAGRIHQPGPRAQGSVRPQWNPERTPVWILPGKPVACNYGLLSMSSGLL